MNSFWENADNIATAGTAIESKSTRKVNKVNKVNVLILLFPPSFRHNSAKQYLLHSVPYALFVLQSPNLFTRNHSMQILKKIPQEDNACKADMVAYISVINNT